MAVSDYKKNHVQEGDDQENAPIDLYSSQDLLKSLNVLQFDSRDEYYSLNVNLHKIDVLLSKSFQKCYRGLDYFSERVESRSSTVWVLEDSIGVYVALSYIRPNGKRDGTCVLPEYQRKGLARHLLMKSQGLFRNQSSIVPQHKKAIIAFYTKNGFKPVGDLSEVLLTITEEEALDICNPRQKNGVLIFDRINRRIDKIEECLICFKHNNPPLA